MLGPPCDSHAGCWSEQSWWAQRQTETDVKSISPKCVGVRTALRFRRAAIRPGLTPVNNVTV